MNANTSPTTSSVTSATTLGGGGSDASLDVDALLTGVYRRHRSYQRRRLIGSGMGIVCAAALTAVLVTGGGNASSPDPGSHETAVVALSPYTLSANAQAAPVATVDGLELTYLPPNLPAQPTIETGVTGANETYTQACFGDPGCAGDSLGVAVTRSPGLDLDGYQLTHWLGDDPTETTVGALPALATGVESDQASGLVWSPQPGVVIEINIDSDMAAELRQVVDGARFTG
jgi:hypothetical protein